MSGADESIRRLERETDWEDPQSVLRLFHLALRGGNLELAKRCQEHAQRISRTGPQWRQLRDLDAWADAWTKMFWAIRANPPRSDDDDYLEDLLTGRVSRRTFEAGSALPRVFRDVLRVAQETFGSSSFTRGQLSREAQQQLRDEKGGKLKDASVDVFVSRALAEAEAHDYVRRVGNLTHHARRGRGQILYALTERGHQAAAGDRLAAAERRGEEWADAAIARYESAPPVEDALPDWVTEHERGQAMARKAKPARATRKSTPKKKSFREAFPVPIPRPQGRRRKVEYVYPAPPLPYDELPPMFGPSLPAPEPRPDYEIPPMFYGARFNPSCEVCYGEGCGYCASCPRCYSPLASDGFCGYCRANPPTGRCHNCGGSGQDIHPTHGFPIPCPRCAGRGMMTRENPLLAVVGNARRKRRKNPTPAKQKKLTLDDVQNAPGFEKAKKAFKKFHEQDPHGAVVMRFDDGKPGVTRKVVVALGQVPETHYVTPWESNKKGYYWVHKHPKKGMPLEVLDPETGLTSKIGGTYKVTDWWHK